MLQPPTSPRLRGASCAGLRRLDKVLSRHAHPGRRQCRKNSRLDLGTGTLPTLRFVASRGQDLRLHGLDQPFLSPPFLSRLEDLGPCNGRRGPPVLSERSKAASTISRPALHPPPIPPFRRLLPQLLAPLARDELLKILAKQLTPAPGFLDEQQAPPQLPTE